MAEQGEPTAGAVKDEFLEQHLWPPFTQMQGIKPIVMERAEGAVVWDSDGNEYIDAFASLWTVKCLGQPLRSRAPANWSKKPLQTMASTSASG